MTNQEFQASQTSRSAAGEVADGMFSKASELSQQAAEGVKGAASEAVSGAVHHVRDALDRQVERGAETIGLVAGSIRCAAEDLDTTVPQLAGLVHASADIVERYAETLADQSAEDVWQSAVDFTRRQPAVVFGIAALVGFLALRTFKNAEPVRSPPIQPDNGPKRRKHA